MPEQCPTCRTPAEPDQRFCNRCGTKLGESALAPATAVKQLPYDPVDAHTQHQPGPPPSYNARPAPGPAPYPPPSGPPAPTGPPAPPPGATAHTAPPTNAVPPSQ